MHPVNILLFGVVLAVFVNYGSGDRSHLEKRGVETARRVNGPPLRRRTRPNLSAPPYAVQMEPLVKYSQRDPLYHQKTKNETIESSNSRGDSEPEPSNNIGEVASPYGYEQQQYPQQYYQEPEPIIEIIIKESNESLPAPPPPPTLPPVPSTKEPVHVFYVKYQKNPHATGKDGESDVIYEKPVPALTSHQSDVVEEDHNAPVQPPDDSYGYGPTSITEQAPSTTLRTIIRPDSEIYHGSGLKVTFENPSHHQNDRSEVELEPSASETGVEPIEQDEAQKRDSSELPEKPSQFKRQQGPYLPQYNSQEPLQQSKQEQPQYQQPLPSPFGSPQARPLSPGADIRQQNFNRGSHKPTYSSQPTSQANFRPQHTSAIFHRPQQFREQSSQGSSPPLVNGNGFGTPTNQQQPTYVDHLAIKSRPSHSSHQSQNYKQNVPLAQNYQPNNNFADSGPQRQQFQPTLAAQIEQYQQHKQFLYQQSLRQQALQQQQSSVQNSQLNHRPSASPLRPQQQQEYPQYKSQPSIQVQPSIPTQFHRQQQHFSQQQKEVPSKLSSQQYSFSPSQSPVYNDLHSGVKTSYVTSPPQTQQQFKPSYSPPSAIQQPTPKVQSQFGQNYQTNKGPTYVKSQQPVFGQKQSVYQNPQSFSSAGSSSKDSVRIPSQAGKPSSVTFDGGEIVQSISPLESHQIQPAHKITKTNYQQHKNTEYSPVPNSQNYNPSESYKPLQQSERHKPQESFVSQQDYTAKQSHKPQESYKQENHRYEPVYVSSTSKPRPSFTSRTSTTESPQTKNKVYSLVPSSTESSRNNEHVYEEENGDKKEILSAKEEEKKKANLASLPDEVPEDLREQLLSSGILGNADIQILDYDKVGDIPIESLPPEALENLYGAGSDPIPSVVKPESPPEKKPVEMKVVRYDPNTKEGQSVADTYVREDATQLDPVVLNDSRYNRYLPLKVSGTQFPIPDVPQLKNRVVNSVVVLAPVDYDFIKTPEQPETIDRSGKAVQVQGVRFVAGNILKDVVKNPTAENYKKWLEMEKASPTERQSVVLLVTRPEDEKEDKNMEIYMYDISNEKVSKLNGELSSAFVEVAQSNSQSEEIDELATQPVQEQKST